MSTHNPIDQLLAASATGRVRAIHSLAAVEPAVEVEFDRLARLAARFLRVPIALISLVERDRQVFRGLSGLGGIYAEQRSTPLSHSFCKYVVASNEPLVVSHAPSDNRFCDHPAIEDLGVIAYLGVPIHTPNGETIGTICAIDSEPRNWNDDDFALLHELAKTVEVEIALCVALNERNGIQHYLELQRQAFAALATDSSLDHVLAIMAQAIEARLPGALCSISRFDPHDQCLYHVAAPSLPAGFIYLIDGMRIGPFAGSCGTAAYFGEPVIVADIAADRRWDPWRAVAHSYNLHACWSLPIRTGNGQMFGTFAIYYHEPHPPEDVEIAVVNEAMQAVTLAFDRWQTLDRLRAGERRLRLSEADLLAVFEHTDDAIWTVDRQLRVQRFNQRASDGFLRHYGHRLQVDMPFTDVLPPQVRADWEHLARRALAGERISLEHSETVDQHEESFEALYAPLWVDGQISGLAIFSRNITARKQAEAERLEMERSWQETQRLESLGVLAGGIAHDFNNLLAAILGNAELGLLDSSEDAPLHEYFSQIATAARHGAGLTRQILAYTGRGQTRLEVFDLHHLIREIVALLQNTLPHPIRILSELNAVQATIAGEVTQMKQVIMNLLINAAEASSDNSDVLIRTAIRDGYVEIAVIDQGVGMDVPLQQRIFEPFFTTKFAGRGLGLAVVHGIVRSHHGTLQVDSAPGRGTCFTVALPRVSPLHAADAHRNTPFVPLLHNITMLVIDDDPEVRRTVVQLLERIGVTMFIAADGQEALRILAETPTIQLVLQDWTMPGLHGLELWEAIRAQRPDIPILVMSGYQEQQIVIPLAGTAMDGFIAKPFDVQQLQDALDQVLRTHLVQ